jgi:hypothetical protein
LPALKALTALSAVDQ